MSLTHKLRPELISCPACAAFRNRAIGAAQLVGSLEPVVAPADFDMRLRARIAATRTAESQPFFARLIGVPAIAMAAVVVIAVGTTVLISQRNSLRPQEFCSTASCANG